jgi:hypothetical protein
MLGVILALMLPANFVLLNATGPVLFDGQALAYVTLNGTRAAVELPLVPGGHAVSYGGSTENMSFFDYVCDTEGTFQCNVTAHHELELPYSLWCGSGTDGVLELDAGGNATLTAGDNCDFAQLTLGDFYDAFRFTPVFTNYITFEGEREVTVFQQGQPVLRKFGREYVGFPELEPGEYTVKAGFMDGKLLIRPRETAPLGFALSALLVMAAVSLLWMG